MKTVGKAFKYILLIFFACIFLIPLLYALFTSLVPFEYVNKIEGLQHLSLNNYATLFKNYPILTWFKNTAIVTVCTLIGTVVTALPAGYALAKFKFKGRNAIFTAIMATLMVPFQLVLTPLYIMVAGLGWHNTLQGLIVPFLVSSLSIFMARQFYKSIPDELIEAARVDGLGHIGSFFHIVLPLSKPLIITLSILNFTSTWNSYMIPATFLSQTEKFTLSVGLKTIKAANFIRPNETMAGVILLSIPVLIFFFFLQKWFIQGIASSGLKE